MAARVDDRPQLHGVLASGAQLGEERTHASCARSSIASKGAALALSRATMMSWYLASNRVVSGGEQPPAFGIWGWNAAVKVVLRLSEIDPAAVEAFGVGEPRCAEVVGAGLVLDPCCQPDNGGVRRARTRTRTRG